MVATLAEHADPVDESVIQGTFPVDRQRRLVSESSRTMGFDPAAWRMDDAVHPFATSFGNRDVRITTRWDESNLLSALYGGDARVRPRAVRGGDRRLAPAHPARPRRVAQPARVAEPDVGEHGRSGAAVLRGARAADRGAVFATSSRTSRQTRFYRAVNRVSPSFIRVEADEATYGLHVILRFELEQELIEGTLAIKDLPEAWNARFKEYLGIDVTDDALGVLQDVHWSFGAIGYFPTYALGNLIAGQLWERAQSDIPDLDDKLAAGRARRCCASGCASTSTVTARSFRRTSCSSASSARRSRSVRSSRT